LKRGFIIIIKEAMKQNIPRPKVDLSDVDILNIKVSDAAKEV
jgi:hypothetical protein